MFYLDGFVGSGTTLADPIRPPVDGAKRIIDLRGDPTDPAGRCLLWTPERQPPSPARITLGDDLDEPMPRAVSRILGNTLGVNLDATDRLRSVIVELLLVHGTADHDQSRWNRLRAGRGRHRIWLGELVFDAPAILGTSFTETWTAANSDTIDADQDWTEVSGNHFEIISNKVRTKDPGATNEDGFARAEVDLDSDDHYAQADCTWLNDLSAWVGPAVRFAAAASTFYLAIAGAHLDEEHIFKCEAGTFTDLGSQARTLAASTLLLRLEANGSDLHAEFDSGQPGESILDITDASISGNVRAGFYGNALAAAARQVEVDNFEAGDLGTPGTASPGVIAATTTLPAATAVGPGSSSPAATATTTAFPAVTVAGSGVSEPAAIPTSVTLPQVTVSGGAVATPGVLALTVTLPQATGSGGAEPGTVTPEAIAAVVDLLAASVAGAAEIAPGVIALTVTLPQVSAFQPAEHPPGPATAPIAGTGTSTAPSQSATLSAVLIITGKSAAAPNTGKSTAPGSSSESEAE